MCIRESMSIDDNSLIATSSVGVSCTRALVFERTEPDKETFPRHHSSALRLHNRQSWLRKTRAVGAITEFSLSTGNSNCGWAGGCCLEGKLQLVDLCIIGPRRYRWRTSNRVVDMFPLKRLVGLWSRMTRAYLPFRLGFWHFRYETCLPCCQFC